jgi:hypothetical protein
MSTPRAKRGAGYTTHEINALLDLLAEHLPLSAIEWKRVVEEHKVNFPAEDRSLESIKRKFQDLYRVKAPSGAPDIPPEVYRAKEIQKARDERTHASDCEGADELEIEEPVTTYVETPPSNDGNNNNNNSGEEVASLSTRNTEANDAASATSNILGTRARPLVVPGHAATRKRKHDENESIQDLFKLFMMQRQQDDMRRAQERDEYQRQRDEDMRRREEERLEERRRRDEERQEDKRRWEEERRIDREYRRANEAMLNHMLAAVFARNSGNTQAHPLPEMVPAQTSNASSTELVRAQSNALSNDNSQNLNHQKVTDNDEKEQK